MASKHKCIPGRVLMLGALLVISPTSHAQREYSNTRRVHKPEATGTSKDARTALTSKDATVASNSVFVSGEYSVGEADVLRISVWKEPELSQTVVVRPDGKITLPLVNEISVRGMTPVVIQGLLVKKLKAYLADPQVTVTVVEIHSKMVYITGEVGRPGAYPVLAPMNVLQLLARAGGLTQFAVRKGIFILRSANGIQQHYRFNYQEVIRGRNIGQNIELQPGDTVVVP